MRFLSRSSVIVMVLFGWLGCGGDSGSSPTPTPTPATNRAPTISSLLFSPTFGIQSLTTYTFSAVASDPDGDAVTYSWDVAGNPFLGPGGSAIFSTGGSLTARLTVSDGRGGTATDSRAFVCGSMTGVWVGVSGPSALGSYRFTLQQTSGVVTGTYFDSTYGNGVLDPGEPGRIDANGNVTIRVKQGSYRDWYFTGVMATTGRSITGTVRGSGFTGQPFEIAKQ